MRSVAFYSQLNCAKTLGNRILNFGLKHFLQVPKVKKNWNWLWKALKNFGEKNQNSVSNRFCAIELEVECRRPHANISKTVGLVWTFVNLYFFTKTGNTANWQQCRWARRRRTNRQTDQQTHLFTGC